MASFCATGGDGLPQRIGGRGAHRCLRGQCCRAGRKTTLGRAPQTSRVSTTPPPLPFGACWLLSVWCVTSHLLGACVPWQRSLLSQLLQACLWLLATSIALGHPGPSGDVWLAHLCSAAITYRQAQVPPTGLPCVGDLGGVGSFSFPHFLLCPMPPSLQVGQRTVCAPSGERPPPPAAMLASSARVLTHISFSPETQTLSVSAHTKCKKKKKKGATLQRSQSSHPRGAALPLTLSPLECLKDKINFGRPKATLCPPKVLQR